MKMEKTLKGPNLIFHAVRSKKSDIGRNIRYSLCCQNGSSRIPIANFAEQLVVRVSHITQKKFLRAVFLKKKVWSYLTQNRQIIVWNVTDSIMPSKDVTQYTENFCLQSDQKVLGQTIELLPNTTCIHVWFRIESLSCQTANQQLIHYHFPIHFFAS